jgi:NadR type nicotinamide-nucleotide adenylyltransferase
MKNALVLMTALVPTTGHYDLIDFASKLPDAEVHVLVSTRSFEPISHLDRIEPLTKSFRNHNNVYIHGHMDDKAPQNPSESAEFWSWWKNTIETQIREVEKWDYVIASEPYGLQVAQVLGATFIPYDIERHLNDIKGQDVRSKPWSNWNKILPEFRREKALVFTLFGQESVGKTTIARIVAESFGTKYIPEYARPYLEFIGPDLDDAIMENIYKGQFAYQVMAKENSKVPVVIQDTDLFSTVGYYRLHFNREPEHVLEDALKTRSDLYFLLPDDVPFEEDILRYGGSVRESSIEFWEQLLQEIGLKYIKVPEGTLESKLNFVEESIKSEFDLYWEAIKSFVRE